MEEISAKQIARLRKKLGFNQREFAEEIGVSSAAVGPWEMGKTNPRGTNRESLMALYVEHFPPREEDAGGSQRGGRHLVSVSRTQEALAELDEIRLASAAATTAKFVAEKYELDYTTFREALVVFLYGVDAKSTVDVAQALSGHK